MKKNSIIQSIFFGNYFYGLCAVGLSIEATVQQRYPLNPAYFYIGLAAITIWYYTKAYITEEHVVSHNERTNWYSRNRLFVQWSQNILLLVCLALLLLFLKDEWKKLAEVSLMQWLLVLIFPLVAALYYGINYKVVGNVNLRNVGWMKPFVIGFTWAGLANVYPIVFYDIVHGTTASINLIAVLLFIKNFMFVTVLCIMFDIKDYAMDSNQQLKTFVVKNGLRKTIFYIIIPLSVAGLGSFLLYGSTHHFSLMKILLNTIPFICMIAVAYSLHKRKGIMYYLILIDGLMLLKAICGTIAMTCF